MYRKFLSLKTGFVYFYVHRLKVVDQNLYPTVGERFCTICFLQVRFGLKWQPFHFPDC